MSSLRHAADSGGSIRPMGDDDLDAVAALSLRAWKPVDRSFQAVLGDRIYNRLYPDWGTSQEAGVRRVCTDPGTSAFVSDRDGVVTGFVALVVNPDPPTGVVEMIAVDPPHQRQGVGRNLTLFALAHFAAMGLPLVNVGTGGDPGHTPARKLYESVGFVALPLVNYYRALEPQ
jgi:ribosomal protein S18 acetylase RimI-like enzyme